jgi:MerR family transcriptional regulator/heat shock protein HspR
MALKDIGRKRKTKGYTISAVADHYGVHQQTLRLYEREGLLKPSRSEGNVRLYTDEDIERLEVILNLTRDLGVNLAGVEIILKMRRRMTDMQRQIEDLVGYLRESGGDAPGAAQEPREALVRAASNQLKSLDLF